MQEIMVSGGGTPAANVAPGVMPPFLSDLRKIQRFRREAIKPTVKDKLTVHYQFEVQPGVACGGCVEP